MRTMTIQRILDGTKYNISLTDQEMERAFRIRKSNYLKEDFSTAIRSTIGSDFFTPEDIEQFPEILEWLADRFEILEDSNMDHNSLLELSLSQLDRAAVTPEFFAKMAVLSPALCNGDVVSVSECEEKCEKYYRCSCVASANDRSRAWETLGSLVSMHQKGICTCSDTETCKAADYLSGRIRFPEFFHAAAEVLKEAG